MVLGVAGSILLLSGGVKGQAAPSTPTEVRVADRGLDRGPRFMSAPSERTGERTDMSRSAVLRRRISVTLVSVTLEQALDAIAGQVGLHFTYSRATAPLDHHVSLDAADITVAAALTEILFDTGVDIELSPDGRAALIPHAEHGLVLGLSPQPSGVITGHVTDAVLKTPLSQVSVRIDGMSSRNALSGASGEYTIGGVAPGTYRVTARRVGYPPLTKDVTVSSGRTELDFALLAAPTKLDEIVTTAVGQQRRYEVGNTISTINVDSIAPTAPVTSLTDLISARAPGVVVEETSGLTGSGETIRIRGQSSLLLQGDPIVIVDGVRQDNSPSGTVQTPVYGPDIIGTSVSVPTPSRLNDLDFNDIQSIDVLKGPAASTEYGTDAANGVIVITTKHGQTGQPQWHASAEQTESAIPESFPALYYSWGHTTDGANTPVQCPLMPFLSGYGSVTGNCATDSVTTWDPLNNPDYSIFGTGNRAKYDLSVGGGSEAARYYISGGLSNETGILRMPQAFLAQATAARLPHSVFNPNGEDQRSVRASTAIRLGSTADLSVTGAYLSTYQTTPAVQDLFQGMVQAPSVRDSADTYGYGTDPSWSPVYQFGNPTSQQTDRLTGGMTANWRPASWFVGHATVGVDHGSLRDQTAILPQVASVASFIPAQLGIETGTTDIYTVDIRGSVTAALTHGIGTLTSVGMQLADRRMQGTTVTASGITATNFTLNGAVGPTVTQLGDRQATLGGYVEEQVSLADRLFLTGAVRIDAGSGFGRSYSTATYPKGSISWLALNSGGTSVRLRGAFGESGVQPPNGSALELLAPTAVWSGSGPAAAVGITNVANPFLQPERSSEYEGGADIGLWGNRLSFELTGYSKTTHDALVGTGTGWELGNYSYEENVGEVRNVGVEGALTATVVQTRLVTWDVSVNASINHNKLVTLAPSVLSQQFYGNYATYRFAPGYPLYGYWGPQVQYADLNHDGIVDLSEVTPGDTLSYAGSSLPTQEVSLGTHLGLWHGALSVGALIDYRGGFRLLNTTRYNEASNAQSDRASNDPTAPLWEQARNVGGTALFYEGIYTTSAQFYEDASYVRFRELSLTYMLPRRVVRALRTQSVTVTGAVRNLALWTHYTGTDPEVANSGGYNTQLNATSNTSIVNNDIRENGWAVPLLRYWVVRLNVGF
jgi:TonB-linked SusC/RagA family outer membrane protein